MSNPNDEKKRCTTSEIKLTPCFRATYNKSIDATYFLRVIAAKWQYLSDTDSPQSKMRNKIARKIISFKPRYKFYKIGITPTWSQHYRQSKNLQYALQDRSIDKEIQQNKQCQSNQFKFLY